MSCGTALCDICGNTFGVSWGACSPVCPRCLGEPKRAEKKKVLLPGHLTWLIRHSSEETIQAALESQRKYPVSSK